MEDRRINLPATNNRNGPLFVLSVWRSGSSLLYSLLNQHSQIALLYEGDLPHLHRFLQGHFHDGSWRERWEFWNQGPSRHAIAIESMPANVSDAWQATRIVYQDVARRKQAMIWGEKTPHWYNRPLQLAGRFPDARFIFLWRDLDAVLRSVASAARTERFFRKIGFAHRILIGSENLRQACDVLTAQHRQVHEVNFEDLIANPSRCLEKICHFLQVPFDERMLSLQGADRTAIASGSHHTMVRGDRIVAYRKQTEVLAPALGAKIQRYVCRWKLRNGGRWPNYPQSLPAGIRTPSLFELWCDRIFYHAVLLRDDLVGAIYAVVPMNVARGLRSWIRRRDNKRELLPV